MFAVVLNFEFLFYTRIWELLLISTVTYYNKITTTTKKEQKQKKNQKDTVQGTIEIHAFDAVAASQNRINTLI